MAKKVSKSTLQKFSAMASSAVLINNTGPMPQGGLKRIVVSTGFVSQGGGNTMAALPAKITKLESDIVLMNDNLIRVNKNIMNTHRHVLELKKILKINANNMNLLNESLIHNFDLLHKKLDDMDKNFMYSGGRGNNTPDKKGGLAETAATAAALRYLLPALGIAAGASGVGLSAYAIKEFFKNSRTNDTGLSRKDAGSTEQDRQQGRDYTNKAVGGAINKKGMQEGIALGTAKGTEEWARERNRASGLGNLPNEGKIVTSIGEKTSDKLVDELVGTEKDTDKLAGMIAAAAGSNLFGSDSDKRNIQNKITDYLKGVLGGAVGGPAATASAIAGGRSGPSGVGGYEPNRQNLFPKSWNRGSGGTVQNGTMSATPPNFMDRGTGAYGSGIPERFRSGGGGNRPYVPSPSSGPTNEKTIDNQLGFNLKSTGGESKALPGKFSGKAEEGGSYGQGALTTDSKGNVDPVAYYKRTRDLIANSKLNGFIPKDGEKYGIKTGSPEEWARLLTANTKQESNFNVSVSGDNNNSHGLGQMTPGDGAKTWGKGLTDSLESIRDPEKAARAIVKAHEYHITKDGVISGVGGDGKWRGIARLNGSYRREHETLKHLEAAGNIAAKAGPVQPSQESNIKVGKSILNKEAGLPNVPGLFGDVTKGGGILEKRGLPTDPGAIKIQDKSAEAGFGTRFGTFSDGVKGLTVHHTAGRGTPDGVISTFQQRNFPAQYIMDREGNIVRALPEGARGQHMRPGQGIGEGYGNHNMEGVEVIARNNDDWTDSQKSKMREFAIWHSKKYGYDPLKTIFGHGEVNPHKEKNEGSVFVDDFRKNYQQYIKEYEQKYKDGATPVGSDPSNITTLKTKVAQKEEDGFNTIKSSKELPDGYGAFLGAKFKPDSSAIKAGAAVTSFNKEVIDVQNMNQKIAFGNVTGANMITGFGGSVGNVFDRSGNPNPWTKNINPGPKIGPTINEASKASKIEEEMFGASKTGDLVTNVFDTKAKEYFGPQGEKDTVQSAKALEAGAGPSLQRLFSDHFGLNEDEDKANDGKWD
jgi:hypothetical protein